VSRPLLLPLPLPLCLSNKIICNCKCSELVKLCHINRRRNTVHVYYRCIRVSLMRSWRHLGDRCPLRCRHTWHSEQMWRLLYRCHSGRYMTGWQWADRTPPRLDNLSSVSPTRLERQTLLSSRIAPVKIITVVYGRRRNHEFHEGSFSRGRKHGTPLVGASTWQEQQTN